MASDWRFVVSGTAVDPEANYGFVIQNYNGAGMPPLNNISTDFGLLDGGIFQRQRAGVRTMTLNGIVNGSSVTDLHTKRKSLINAIKPDRSASQQAMVIQYTGGASTVQASAFYDDGLSLGNVDVYREAIGLRFLMYDPYWEKTTSSSATLTTQATIASPRGAIQRAASGAWSGLGSGLNDSVRTITSTSTGALILAGDFTAASGTTACRIVSWNNGFSNVGNGFNNGLIYSVVVGNDGYIYAGGTFGSASNVTASNVARYTGTGWTTMASGLRINGGLTGYVDQLALDRDGNILAVGYFDTVGSGAGQSTACAIAKWTVSSSSWSHVASGARSRSTATSVIYGVGAQNNGDIWIIGDFSAAGASTNTACKIAIYSYTGSTWGTVGASGSHRDTYTGSLVAWYNMIITNNGTVYMTPNTVGTAYAATYYTDGTNIRLSGSIVSSGEDTSYISYDRYKDIIYVSGTFTAINGTRLDRNARLIGNTFTPLDVSFNSGAVVFTAHSASDGVLTLGHSGTSACVAAVTTVTNNGTANVYPILTACAPTSSSAQIIQFVNYTTGDAIYFNLPLLAGEMITLDLRIGKKTFTSSTRGNILNTIVPGSNLVTWKLAPGNNNVSFFMSSGSGAAKLTWTERFWSIDV